MTLNEKFYDLKLDNNILFLSRKGSVKKELKMSELEKIYIQLYTQQHFYKFLFMVFAAVILIFTVIYLALNPFEIVLELAMIVSIYFLNFYNFKKYKLELKLKNGGKLSYLIPLKKRQETIDKVRYIRAKMTISDRLN